MRKTTFFLVLFFSVLIISAQTKRESYNSLLWRISGNGLTKPSYVYGTIHITDKRVFYFSDSLYKSLEQSEGFAAELDINNLFSNYFTGFGEKKERSEILLVDSLDKKTMARYKTKLEAKFNKPFNKITIADIEDAKSEWMQHILKNGEMNTLMDAWLFDLARRQGKWVGGIEDFEDQDGLEDSISLVEKIETFSARLDEKNSMLEWMIGIYIKQHLDSIDLRAEVFQGSRDALLVRRNIKMARRMDSLARIRSMFFAVGAAHIPGNDGVIYLLRQKGFTITPVHSNTKIEPGNYEYKQVDLPWYNVEDTSGSYSVIMPGKPISNPIAGDGSPEMKMYFDFGSMRFYLALSMPVPNTGKFDRDSALNSFIQYYRTTGDSIAERNIVVNGLRGKEITGLFDGNQMRMQCFFQRSTIMMMAVGGFKKQVLYGPDADKFFNSLKIRSNSSPVVSKINAKWERYNFNKLGFSVELPLKYKEEKVEREDPSWDMKYFQTFDLSSGTFLGIIVSIVKKGFYSSSDSSFFEESAENLVTTMQAEIVSREHLSRFGYPAFTATATSSRNGEEVIIQLLLINKGPYRYLLFAVTDEKSKPGAVSKFFDSFNLLNEENKNWDRRPAPDNSFNIWGPAPVLLENELAKQKNETRYLLYDTTSHMQIFIDKEKFPDYFWAEGDSSLLSDKSTTFISDGDSVIFNKHFSAGKIKGVDLLVQYSGTHNLKRLKCFLNGDTLYTIYTFLPAQYLETENYQKLFDEFKINYETVSTSLFKRKTEKLLLALQTKDSADFEKAKEAFDYVTFLKEDVPYLQKALLYPYYDFDSSYYYNTNQSISGYIQALDSNNTTITFAKENYFKLTGDKELMKPFLLSLLSSIKTTESYDVLKQLITSSPPKIAKEYYWKNSLYDSLSLTRNLFPEILSLAGDPGAYDFINDVTLTLLDSNLIDVEMIKKYSAGYIKTGKRMLDLTKEEQERTFYYYSSLAKLLGKINDPEGNEVLKKIGTIDANSLKLDVVLAQAASNQQPDAKNVTRLASSDEFRKDLYEGLKEVKKLNLFPKEFLNQKALSQSAIFNYANEDENPPDSVEYIGERIETYRGEKQKFYLYKIHFVYEADDDEDDECYFAMAGPYSLNQQILESNDEVTEVYWQDLFDSDKINEWVKEIIDRTEKWLKERDALKKGSH